MDERGEETPVGVLIARCAVDAIDKMCGEDLAEYPAAVVVLIKTSDSVYMASGGCRCSNCRDVLKEGLDRVTALWDDAHREALN